MTNQKTFITFSTLFETERWNLYWNIPFFKAPILRHFIHASQSCHFKGYPHSSSTTASLLQPHLRAAASAAVAGTGNSLERSRQMASSGIGERASRDRSSDSNDHNSEDGDVLSGVEDEDGGQSDQAGQSADGKTKARKKKTRTVFSRSQVCTTIMYFMSGLLIWWHYNICILGISIGVNFWYQEIFI